MGRPSKKEERTEEILNAFYRCVARFGIEGSTLERIAEEAGLKRSLVRHFVGNREELIGLLVDRVLQQSDEQWGAFMSMLPEQNGSQFLLEGLFSEQHSDPEYVLVIESLIFAAGREDDMRQRMQAWMQSFTDDVASVLLKDYPNAEGDRIAAVSYGLISLYFNLDSLAPLGMNQQYRQPARTAAEYLLHTLESATSDKGD